ncbi:transcriptional regulator with XRE-family HTH domain [Paenibacillus sp. LBL]|uniref:helix-turn-helix domain-containing protein n=1 Tax=Paenibacillus sp. LBL TaxID=2940563 RepID=UPI0024758B54|nr:helix-turn-helix transcriptional regulator [Paenibacillus sp. LBL]MDH6672674.1 transcriptional regulator with XRE-family HTH domain [Paenibacillus sp. LBL]
MIHTTTIRSELETYLKKTGLTINQFGELSKINSGTLSTIIKGVRPIAMQQLDRIVAAMGLPEGSFYELYLEECFSYPLNWRRLKPFLYRCAELDKLMLIQKVVRYMTDNLAYVPLLFDTAEVLLNQEKRSAAAIIYESVAESEKYQHSERLALCHYRLFTISIGHDQEKNLRAATKFEGFVERLDEIDQLDALKDLANTYLSLRQWGKVDEMSKEMGRKATIQYHHKYNQNSRFKYNLLKKPKRPLFLYIIYSHLLRSAVCDEMGNYELALKYVSLYSDLSWVKEDTAEALRIKEEFKILALVNTCLYQLMMGQVEVLPQYVAYVESREAEILPALIKIIQAANKYNFNIDFVLEKFESQISSYAVKQANIGTYTYQVVADRYTHFLSELSLYYLRSQRYDIGINCLLDCLASAIEIHSDSAILNCVRMFEKFRDFTSVEVQNKYNTLISEVPKK